MGEVVARTRRRVRVVLPRYQNPQIPKIIFLLIPILSSHNSAHRGILQIPPVVRRPQVSRRVNVLFKSKI